MPSSQTSSQLHVPSISCPKLPPTMTSLYHPKYQDIPSSQLAEECEHVFRNINITKEEANYLTHSTTLQSMSLLRHEHRKGRITASLFGQVCHTSIENPSKSLVNAIIKRPLIHSPALTWGVENEDAAIEEYHQLISAEHISTSLSRTGLHINPSYPHLGASPDALIECECCGEGLVEVKCPYSIRSDDPNTSRKSFYLVDTPNGKQLNQKSNYYYQIQGQLAVCDRAYCDFVCWTPVGMFIQRIERDDHFFQEMKNRLDMFCLRVIMPLLLKGETSRSDTVTTLPESATTSTEQFCYCRKGDKGLMVACDNPNCSITWFHWSCVKLKSEPLGDWFCPDCRLVLRK